MSQQKGFLDRVLQFMGIEEENISIEKNEAVQEPIEKTGEKDKKLINKPNEIDLGQKGKLIGLSGSQDKNRRLRMSVIKPESFDGVQSIADNLKQGEPVVLSLEYLDKTVAKRMIDFLSGTTYAVDGSMHRLNEQLFLLAPKNVEIEGSLKLIQEDGE